MGLVLTVLAVYRDNSCDGAHLRLPRWQPLRSQRRLVMRRFAVLVSVVVIVLLSSAVVLSRPPAAAQEATPSGTAAMASHPVVGGWRITVELGEGMTSPDLQIFHADGT